VKQGTNKMLTIEDASGYVSITVPALNATDFALAHLLAAAPEMLEALKALLKSNAIYDEERTDEIIRAVDLTRKAIAKAEGRS